MNFRQFFAHNTWWGKLSGAFLGYLTAGPVGAFFGVLIGNFFDRGLAHHALRPHWHYHAEKRKSVQKIFFEATFTIMGYIAKSDGRVSEQEILMAKTVMQEMELNRIQKTAAQTYFNAGKQSDFRPNAILTLLKQATKDNPELLKLFLEIQYRAAHVDGLSSKKQQYLNAIFTQLGFAPLHKQHRFYEDFIYNNHDKANESDKQRSQSSYQPAYGMLDHAYSILEVTPNATKQDVKRAYRRLMSRNHPDKMIARGLPEEMVKIANEKTQKIRKAYEQICEGKGW